MKKIFITVITLLTVILCTTCVFTKDEPISDIMPSKVLVYSGSHIKAPMRTAYNIPENEMYQVYYFIRIDGNIPGEDAENLPANEYFPQTKNKKSFTGELNSGKVNANVNWRSSNKFSKYIYSTDGSAVQSIIVSHPTLLDLVNADKSNMNFTGYLQHEDSLHFLWYICKQQDADKCWHVDGILTSINRTNISDTQYGQEIIDNYNKQNMFTDFGDVNRTAHVEVDIHQQEHKDWNEIKTSIHLRDTVAVDVLLPVEYNLLADDFAIRNGVNYRYITELPESIITINEVEYTFYVSITHDDNGILIHIEPNRDALIAAREIYDDGITFEIHNYVSNIVPSEPIWEMLKKSTCDTYPYTSINGQVTSAYFEDIIKL